MRLLLLSSLFAVTLFCAGSAEAAKSDREAERAYQSARQGYYQLKSDVNRRKLRHHWLAVAEKFEQVGRRFPKNSRAPEALFTAAQTFEELSRISGLEEDLSRGIRAYQLILSAHPRHRLADDAALQLALIYRDRLGRLADARHAATQGLQSKSADHRGQLRKLLASLPGEARATDAKATRSPAKPVAAQRPASAPPADEPGTELEPKSAFLAAIERLARSSTVEWEPVAEASKPEPSQRSEASKPEPSQRSEASKPEPSQTEADHEVAAEELAQNEKPITSEREVTKVDGRTARARLRALDRPAVDLTVAEQLGLKVRRVIIDPGHGGHDSGAVGPGGTQEKDVSLAIANKLADELKDAGLEVVLTRDDDRFVRLEDRTGLANARKGDLFISLHCNSASDRKLRGVEVYTLNTASDRYSIRLAARENASSALRLSDLQFVLADLATKVNTTESSQLATNIQRSMVQRLSSRYRAVKDLGHKQALFYVLLGAKMPAILVETSFISNPEEEQRLRSSDYQAQVAHAISLGVQDFLGQRARLATVE